VPSTDTSSRSAVSRALSSARVPDLGAAKDAGAGRALESARGRDPVAVIDEIERSGLRGRGGAGFPTGRKWRTVCRYETGAVELPTVVVNAAEGEPGSFKDREILRRDPYRVLEGALIAAHAVGADTVVVALRSSAVEERERVERAIEEARAEGWCGDLDVRVFSGPEEYLVGEETGLLEALDGRDPFPRIAPPYRRGVDEIGDADVAAGTAAGRKSAAGLELAGPTEETVAAPTLVNNVETMANVPGILREGADWFRSVGTDESPGTIVCTVTGAVDHAGVGEVALGTPLRGAIETIAGGARPGHRLTAVLSGVSNALVRAHDLDTPLTYEAMAAIGSGLGCGAFIVFDDETDFVAVAAGVARFLAIESCGQCTPCKQDGLALAELFERVSRSDAGDDELAAIDDHLATVADSARCNLASQFQAVLGSVLTDHRDQVDAHARRAVPPADAVLVAPIVDLSDGVALLEESHRAKQPDWSFDDVWSGRAPADEREGEAR
jgi:NADH:ubiquinone oxidoreductase subunit F (NADH-binding)